MATIADRPVGRIGFGLMGLTWRPDPPSYEHCFAVMKAALARGANFWNGGDLYGTPDANSLHLLKAYFTKYPEDADKVVLSIKGGVDIAGGMKIDGTEAGVRESVEKCLRVLEGTKKIDVFEYARLDPKVPVEETVRALKTLQDEGKIGGIGLSEVRAETIRRAAAVAPIAAVEIELSLATREPLSNGIVSTCAELGIPIVAYSPLSRGLLTGTLRSASDVPDGDLRKHLPRFQQQALEVNLKLADAVCELAQKKGCKASQLAIAWVASQSMPNAPIIPIPGTSSIERVDENLTDVSLTSDEKEEIAEILTKCPVEGSRYAEAQLKFCDA
ncbi:hypothetical protein VTO42DRAFT_1928 [Malbranchea cinnamomea]